MTGTKPKPRAAVPDLSLPREALVALGPHLSPLIDEIIEAIGHEVPAYARPLEGRFGEVVRRGVEDALGHFGEWAVRGRAAGRNPAREIAHALGRGEFRQGRTLEALLAAYRVGARLAWRRLATAGIEAGLTPETLVALAELIFAYIDELSAESAEGYTREQTASAGEVERRRSALVETLLREPPAPEDALAAAADAARWTVPRDLAVVVWAAEHGQRPIGRLPMGSITAPVGSLHCAIVPDPLAPGRRGELDRAIDEVPAGLGSSVPPAAAARSYHRALAALGLGMPRLTAADEHRAALLARADPPLVADIAADRLAPLEEETTVSRARLEATLLAWLRHQGNIPAAAAELHVHAQTVRYRLTRLRELLGPALEDPDARYELETVLRALTPAAAARPAPDGR